MTEKLATFDPAELLQDNEAIAIYMDGVFETGMPVTLRTHWGSWLVRAA